MSEKLLCLGCFDDLAEPGTYPAYCLTCGMKHEDAVWASSRSHGARSGRIGWDGMTGWDIDPEDIQYGFHEVTFSSAKADSTSWANDGTVFDQWKGGVWRGCHSCGQLFEEKEWPSSPRCDACEFGLQSVEV